MSILLLAAVAVTAARAAEEPLAHYRWRSRILLLSAPAADDATLTAQRRALASERRGLSERDLAVVEAVGSGGTARALRRRLGLPEDAFRAVLIGKDGGSKLVSEVPIPPRRLFSTIDAMPMRRDESRRR